MAGGGYLVGERFTRADLTLARMLTTVIGLPDDDLFAIDPGCARCSGYRSEPIQHSRRFVAGATTCTAATAASTSRHRQCEAAMSQVAIAGTSDLVWAHKTRQTCKQKRRDHPPSDNVCPQIPSQYRRRNRA
jgi:hypothetical protein